MDYDFSISENVSLSRILDQLIDDNETPEVIINFLKLHDDDFKDIVNNSLCWMRIFQLDFIFACNDDCISYLVNKLADIDYKSAMYLVWQVCKNETALQDSTKRKFRKLALANTNSRQYEAIHSPYSVSAGRYVEKAYDLRFFDACNRRCLVEEMCSMTDNDLRNYCDHIDGSLFKDRFLQYDVFSCLSDIQKFIVLNSLNTADDIKVNRLCCDKFIEQILGSSEMPEVKYEARKHWLHFDFLELDENDYANCSSFSELFLKMSIDGAYDYYNIILRLLAYGRIDILKDWIAYDEAGFNEAFNISDLVKYMLKLKDKKAA